MISGDRLGKPYGAFSHIHINTLAAIKNENQWF